MPSFSQSSKNALLKCHPQLQEIANEAIKEIDFKVLDATRGRADQERAFAAGRSKAHFGQSAHNYIPAIAFDLFPAPYDWNNKQSFIDLYHVIMRIAKKRGIPVRSGLDWNGDGDFKDGWDAPHYELSDPKKGWRFYAEKAKLYEG